jgi:hypothetical protein
MAGVKKQSVGKRVDPVFLPVPCDSCNEIIVKLAEAYRVRVIDMAAGRNHWSWKHRKCLNLNQK